MKALMPQIYLYRSYLAMWTLGLLLCTLFELRSLILLALARITLWPRTSSIVNRFRQMDYMTAPTRGRIVQAQSTSTSSPSGIIQNSFIKPAPQTLDCTDARRMYCRYRRKLDKLSSFPCMDPLDDVEIPIASTCTAFPTASA